MAGRPHARQDGVQGALTICAERGLLAVSSHEMDVVSALCAALIDQIGQPRFDRWFADQTCFSVEDNRLIVSVPNGFYEGWLRRNFRAHLETVASSVCRRAVDVEFVVDPRLEQDNAPRDPAADGQPTLVASPGGERPAERDNGQPELAEEPPAIVKLPATESDKVKSNGRRRFLKLDRYVVGDSNRVAAKAAEMICTQPGQYSPLFLYGSTGTGKTHLLEGIWSRLRYTRPQMRCVFLTSEQFTNYFVSALRGGGIPSFRRKYRDVDLLVIDDVQFFAGKRATLVEVLYTVNSLLESGRQLVLSADRAPGELEMLGPDLAARLQSGVVCRIEMPDMGVRRGILRKLAGEFNETLSDDLLAMVAERMTSNAWELSGALNRLSATRQALDQPLTVELAEQALADLLQQQQRIVRLPDVEKAVCDVLGLDPKALQSSGKARSISYPRMLAMWLARKHTRAALTEIGEYFGRRSHATVIAAQKKVSGWIDDPTTLRLADRPWNISEAIRRVEERLRTG